MKDWLIKIRDADIRNILAIMWSIGVFVMLYIIIIKTIPTANHDIVLMAGGYIFGAVSMVLAYYFAGNKKEKTDNQTQDK
mgnify:CR=1 FL=1